jgi:hypothetical protein
MPGAPATSRGARFDRWASTYDASPLQPALFAPVHQTALQLAQQFLPGARRVLDVGCGTGRLLRQARRRYRPAELIGVDLTRGMLAAAMAATATELGIRYLHAGAECLPFTDEVFDLVFATGPTRRPGSPRSAGCSPPVACSSWRTSSLAAHAEPSRRPCAYAAADPVSPVSSMPRWPPIAWRSSVTTTPPGSACPTRKSSRPNARAQPLGGWSGRAEWGRCVPLTTVATVPFAAFDRRGPSAAVSALARRPHAARSG